MVPVRNEAKRLSSVNDTTRTIHHHHHHHQKMVCKFSFCMGENAFSQSDCRIHKSVIAQEQLSQSAAIN